MAKKLYTHQALAKEYGLGKDTIARYLRVNKLIRELKDKLNADEIPMRVAVSLSYLAPDAQFMVNELLDSEEYQISIRKAEALRAEADEHTLSHGDVKRLLSDKPKTPKPITVKLTDDVMSRYFKAEQTPDEVASVIAEALEMYYKSKENANGDDNEPSASGD